MDGKSLAVQDESEPDEIAANRNTNSNNNKSPSVSTNMENLSISNRCVIAGSNSPANNLIQIPVSGILLQTKDHTNVTSGNIENRFIEIQNDKKSLVNVTDGKKKIVICGPKPITDVNVLQQLLNDIIKKKNNDSQKKTVETITLASNNVENDTRTDINVQISSIKIISNENNTEKNEIMGNMKSKGAVEEQNLVSEEEKSVKCNSPVEEHDVKKKESDKLDKSSLCRSTKNVPKQKKYLYKFNSKNGSIITYISDVPIVVKKPSIRLHKLSTTEIRKLTKQSARGRKKRQEQLKTHKLEDESSCGIQTRKKKLKFLPSGKILKIGKTRRASSASSLSFSDDEPEKNRCRSSDEDYSDSSVVISDSSISDKDEKIDFFGKKSPGTKVYVKEMSPEINAKFTTNDSNEVIGNATAVNEKTGSVKTKKLFTGSQENQLLETRTPRRKEVDPVLLFSSLLGVQFTPNEINTIRFKPKNLKPRVKSNDTIITQKFAISNLLNNLRTALSINVSVSKNNIVQSISQPSFNLEPPPLSPFLKPVLKPSNNLPAQSKQFSAQAHSPSNDRKLAPMPFFEQESLQSTLLKFRHFSDTRVVKTKNGPNKVIARKLNEINSRKTLYDVMSDIFNTMPHWNIHILPENKSFCLAQVSKSRMGAPILKKSIELDMNFKAIVYIHQIHCKRYDGIYDTESKLKKLIEDVDQLIV